MVGPNACRYLSRLFDRCLRARAICLPGLRFQLFSKSWLLASMLSSSGASENSRKMQVPYTPNVARVEYQLFPAFHPTRYEKSFSSQSHRRNAKAPPLLSPCAWLLSPARADSLSLLPPVDERSCPAGSTRRHSICRSGQAAAVPRYCRLPRVCLSRDLPHDQYHSNGQRSCCHRGSCYSR